MLSKRMNKLGTENAFQVALRAARHQEEGNIVYPFHLGDLNFKTPEPVTEAMFKAFGKALDMATGMDERITDVLSTKGSLA